MKYRRDALAEQLKTIPLERRKTIRDTSTALTVPKSTTHRIFQTEDVIHRHINILKPFLSEKRVKGRMEYCVPQNKRNHSPEPGHFFKSSFDTVLADEK